MTAPKQFSSEAQALQKIDRESGNKRFEQDLDWVTREVSARQLRRFQGNLVLNFSNGVVNSINQNHTIKPPHVGE